jgi:hypothetical protein
MSDNRPRPRVQCASTCGHRGDAHEIVALVMPSLQFGGSLGAVIANDRQRLDLKIFGELVLTGEVDAALENWVRIAALRRAGELVCAPDFDIVAALADPAALGIALAAAITADLAEHGIGVSVGQLTLRG